MSFERRFSADPSLRESVSGISPPVEEKHQFYIDVQPMMGTSLRAKARIQINLAVKQVRDIKHVASFPDIVFPIMWFEDVSISIEYRVRSFHRCFYRCSIVVFYRSGRVDRVKRSYTMGELLATTTVTLTMAAAMMPILVARLNIRDGNMEGVRAVASFDASTRDSFRWNDRSCR